MAVMEWNSRADLAESMRERRFSICVDDRWCMMTGGLIQPWRCTIYAYPLFICLYVLCLCLQNNITHDIGCQSVSKKTVPMTLLCSFPSHGLNSLSIS